MKIIGFQGDVPSMIWFMYSKYHKPNSGEVTRLFFEGNYYEYPSLEDYCFSMHTVNSTTTKPVELKQFFKDLPYSDVTQGKAHSFTNKPWKATSIHHLIRLSNNIAKKTRRGLGRYLLCQDPKILTKLDKYDETIINLYYSIITTPLVKSDEIIVTYAGVNDYDKPLVMQANKIYAHPDYKNYMMKVKI